MRKSGILMHITSLPGPYGIGTMGKHAYEFVDFLHKAGQRLWQVLPLNPTGFGDSPYQSCSSLAGNHYLIDLDILAEEGLLRRDELDAVQWSDREDRVDFGVQYANRLQILQLAYGRFQDEAELDGFCLENAHWLPDFALYMALKDENGGKPWYEWTEELKRREPNEMWQARQRLKQQIRFYCFVQYLFHKQWSALLAYAHAKDVQIIGDVPIYVPLDSVDVWTNPELFCLDEDLKPRLVAGCPPDAFSEDGQLWGNPLYRWDVHQDEGFRWWLQRLGAAGKRYDVVRLDHFRGFEAYWSVPYGEPTARNGRWIKGPGMAFVRAVQQNLPCLQVIAEDLGLLTQAVFDLRDASGWPGMRVLEFAFDSPEPSAYLPHTYIHNTVCYIGTHDNMTLRQWLETAPADTVAYAKEYMAITSQKDALWTVICTALRSVADTCILQMQDILELDGSARMNFPGTTGGNWLWRALPDAYGETLAEKLFRVTQMYGRGTDAR